MELVERRLASYGIGLGTALAGYAVIVGALSILTNLSEVGDGEVPAFCRVGLGVIGIVGGVVAATRYRLGPVGGWQVLIAWAALQIPIFTWNVDGSPTTQLWRFPLMVTEKTTVNGRVTELSEFGINLVGVVLLVLIRRVYQAEARKARG